jgi:hypothetical protein
MRSPVTLGLVMILLGGLSASGFGGAGPLHPAQWGLVGLLVAGGLTMLSRRPFTFWVVIGVAAVLAVTGVLARVGHPELALPLPWYGSVGVAVYLVLRAVAARFASPPRATRSPDA